MNSIGVDGRDGFIKDWGNIFSTLKLFNRFIGPPNSRQIDIRKVTVVKGVHIAVGVFRRALITQAMGYIQLANQAVKAFLFGLAVFEVAVGDTIVHHRVELGNHGIKVGIDIRQ